jgi:hypothetical protein
MVSANDGERSPESIGAPMAKRPYTPPKLERLGTIRELTRGLGMNNTFDGANPPGQNKSIL